MPLLSSLDPRDFYYRWQNKEIIPTTERSISDSHAPEEVTIHMQQYSESEQTQPLATDFWGHVKQMAKGVALVTTGFLGYKFWRGSSFGNTTDDSVLQREKIDIDMQNAAIQVRKDSLSPVLISEKIPSLSSQEQDIKHDVDSAILSFPLPDQSKLDIQYRSKQYSKEASYAVSTDTFAKRMPVSSLFQISSNQDKGQTYNPQITSLDNGYIIVVWENSLGEQDISKIDIHGQLFLIDNNMPVYLGNEIKINTNTLETQHNPAVASLDKGKFVVIWDSATGRDGRGIYGQLFTTSVQSGPIRLSDEFFISAISGGSDGVPAVAHLGNDKFVVAWYRYTTSTGSNHIGQIFSYDLINNRLVQLYTNPFPITNTGKYDIKPAIASLSDGNFVIAWVSLSLRGVFGQLFLPSIGSSQPAYIGNVFPIHNITIPGDSNYYTVTAAGLSNGNFVIVSQKDYYFPALYSQVFSSQLINNQPTLLGDKLLISDSARVNRDPKVITLNDRTFIVTWGCGDICGQAFSFNPNNNQLILQGSQIRTGGGSNVRSPAIANFNGDNFVIVWSQTSSDVRIYGQIFSVDNNELPLPSSVPYSQISKDLLGGILGGVIICSAGSIITGALIWAYKRRKKLENLHRHDDNLIELPVFNHIPFPEISFNNKPQAVKDTISAAQQALLKKLKTPYEIVEKGLLEYQSARYANAFFLWGEVLAEKPHWTFLKACLTSAFYGVGQQIHQACQQDLLSNVILQAQYLLEKMPSHAEAYVLQIYQGLAYLGLQQLEQAINCLNQYLQYHSDNAEIKQLAELIAKEIQLRKAQQADLITSKSSFELLLSKLPEQVITGAIDGLPKVIDAHEKLSGVFESGELSKKKQALLKELLQNFLNKSLQWRAGVSRLHIEAIKYELCLALKRFLTHNPKRNHPNHVHLAVKEEEILTDSSLIQAFEQSVSNFVKGVMPNLFLNKSVLEQLQQDKQSLIQISKKWLTFDGVKIPPLLEKLKEFSPKESLEADLLKACQIGCWRMVKMLLACGVNANATDQKGISALMQACEVGNAALVKSLLKAGAEVNYSDVNQSSALWIALQKNDVNLVKQLLIAKANPNIQLISGKKPTPLIQAIKSEATDMVKLLIEYGADPHLTDSDKHDAFWWGDNKLNRHINEVLYEFKIKERQLKREEDQRRLAEERAIQLQKIQREFEHRKTKEKQRKEQELMLGLAELKQRIQDTSSSDLIKQFNALEDLADELKNEDFYILRGDFYYELAEKAVKPQQKTDLYSDALKNYTYAVSYNRSLEKIYEQIQKIEKNLQYIAQQSSRLISDFYKPKYLTPEDLEKKERNKDLLREKLSIS